jgi:ectoine hydroxylase-related dioxygenase (phytanoyl-CoA dioxygenase family)
MTQVMASAWTPMSTDERARFDRDGFLVIRSVLNQEEVARARTAILRYRESVGAAGALHQLSAVTACPELAFLLDHPAAFRYIWSLLGWNIHVYHSHIDVHPQILEQQPQWWHWHQDGGRQNRELEPSVGSGPAGRLGGGTDPRPRMSMKLAYWLSDVSETGRGNFTVLPGSHLTNWLPGPPTRGVPWPEPSGAVEITASPGDVVVFDRRLWHRRSDNYSPITRVGAFFGYTYRWVVGRDDVADLPDRPEWAGFTDVQRQLLGSAGDGSGDHAWGHDPTTTPLYGELQRQGCLDSSIPALIP